MTEEQRPLPSSVSSNTTLLYTVSKQFNMQPIDLKPPGLLSDPEEIKKAFLRSFWFPKLTGKHYVISESKIQKHNHRPSLAFKITLHSFLEESITQEVLEPNDDHDISLHQKLSLGSKLNPPASISSNTTSVEKASLQNKFLPKELIPLDMKKDTCDSIQEERESVDLYDNLSIRKLQGYDPDSLKYSNCMGCVGQGFLPCRSCSSTGRIMCKKCDGHGVFLKLKKKDKVDKVLKKTHLEQRNDTKKNETNCQGACDQSRIKDETVKKTCKSCSQIGYSSCKNCKGLSKMKCTQCEGYGSVRSFTKVTIERKKQTDVSLISFLLPNPKSSSSCCTFEKLENPKELDTLSGTEIFVCQGQDLKNVFQSTDCPEEWTCNQYRTITELGDSKEYVFHSPSRKTVHINPNYIDDEIKQMLIEIFKKYPRHRIRCQKVKIEQILLWNVKCFHGANEFELITFNSPQKGLVMVDTKNVPSLSWLPDLGVLAASVMTFGIGFLLFKR